LIKKVGDHVSDWNHRQAYVRVYKQKIFEELNKIPNFLDERKKRIENKISLLKDKVDLI
jgi:hypothetical protein